MLQTNYQIFQVGELQQMDNWNQMLLHLVEISIHHLTTIVMAVSVEQVWQLLM